MTARQRRPDRTDPSQRPRSAGTGAVGGRAKRIGGLLLGTLLLLRGLGRRSVGGVVLALTGGYVLVRALTGGAGRERTDGARSTTRRADADRPATAVSRSATIDASADELYDAWRDPVVLSQVMGHFAEVTVTDEGRHEWTVHGPAGTRLSWQTRVVEAEQGEVIRWETPSDASVSNGGSVRFQPAPGDRGTLVTLSLDFDPPGGTLGDAAVDRLGVVPETLAGHALGRFKSLVESGEIPTLEGNPSGRGMGDSI